ncbi:BTB/POZ domain-containing protein At1g55760-like [Tasmannia lanceolata]|uniref:BTB/POZ domain-containing protein At1g55760-like n=1 Tax=Tasmannia lanceolata TaxID=3420 RepID=UPI004062E855
MKLRHLTVEKNQVLYIKLYPVISNDSRDQPPIASFNIGMRCSARDHPNLGHPQIEDKQLKNPGDFIWAIETPLAGKIIIEVEFIDLKIEYQDPPFSIWKESVLPLGRCMEALFSLGQMLSENILPDITINDSNGSVPAHRAILATRSPVFHSMFSHNLKEKELSTINISDMSIEACKVFLEYIYGNIKHDVFFIYRLSLLQAADKYDIPDLKEACNESLQQDIDANNVFERLQIASLYRLPELKSSCLRHFVKFGKIYDIREEFNSFLQHANRDLIVDIFQEVLDALKGF